jgi:hypothetical protein
LEKWVLSRTKVFARAHQASVLNFGLQEQNIFQTHISRFHTYQTLFQVFLLLSRHFFSVLDSLKESMLHEMIKAPTVKDYERERFGMYYRKLVSEILLGQITDLGP